MCAALFAVRQYRARAALSSVSRDTKMRLARARISRKNNPMTKAHRCESYSALARLADLYANIMRELLVSISRARVCVYTRAAVIENQRRLRSPSDVTRVCTIMHDLIRVSLIMRIEIYRQIQFVRFT